MTIVVKIGGAAMEEAAILRKCARSIAELAQDGHRVAVVHGGGAALTRMLDRLGKKSEFVDGLRVTDAETRDTALMVLAGIINKKLVAALQSAGMPSAMSSHASRTASLISGSARFRQSVGLSPFVRSRRRR